MTATRPSFSALAERWHTLNTQLIDARKIAARKDKDYRATPDGLAESQRRLDLSGDDTDADRAKLARAHHAAEVEAAKEFRARAARWKVSSSDGYLFALPLGETTPLAAFFVDTHVLGTWRINPETNGPVSVRLLRVHVDGTRVRRKFSHPRPTDGQPGPTLPGVIRAAAADRQLVNRLTGLFGDVDYVRLLDLLDNERKDR